MKTKVCAKCKEEKNINEFSKNSLAKDGKFAWCSSCLSLHRTKVRKKTCAECKKKKNRDLFDTYAQGHLHGRCRECEEKNPAPDNAKECCSCREIKPLCDFFKSRQSQKSGRCIDCEKSAYQESGAYERRRDSDLRKRYGITLEQYKELKEKQGHQCPVCLGPLEEDNFSYPVDHSHGGIHEGVIRGILHDGCNRFIMWKHKDPDTLRRAADLIENPLTDWIVPKEYLKGGRNKRRRKKRVRKT